MLVKPSHDAGPRDKLESNPLYLTNDEKTVAGLAMARCGEAMGRKYSGTMRPRLLA